MSGPGRPAGPVTAAARGIDQRLLGDAELVAALESSRRLGMLGRAPVEDVITHSARFVAALASTRGQVVDLGTGGGVPGLVIARARPDLLMVLVDRRATRTDHVSRLVHRLGLADRVRVLTTDAVSLAKLLPRRTAAVVARGFGPPTAVMRSARAILGIDGLLLVSAPPPGRSGHRWCAELVGKGGFSAVESNHSLVALRVSRETGA